MCQYFSGSTLSFVVIRIAKVLDHCGQWPTAMWTRTYIRAQVRKCTHRVIRQPRKPSHETLYSLAKLYIYIVSRVNERSALTLLSSLRIVLRSVLRVHYTPVAIFEFRTRWHRHSFTFLLSASEKINIKDWHFYRVYVKTIVPHAFREADWEYRGRFMSCKIGMRKNIHGYEVSRSNERNTYSLANVSHYES